MGTIRRKLLLLTIRFAEIKIHVARNLDALDA